MKKNDIKTVLLLFGLSWLLCAQALSDNPDESARALLMTRADSILQALESADFVALSEHVHDASGLGLSPYSRNLSELFITKFQKGEVADFGTDDTSYFWGYYDGMGSPIRLMPKDYFAQFVYDIAFDTKAGKFFLNPDAPQKNLISRRFTTLILMRALYTIISKAPRKRLAKISAHGASCVDPPGNDLKKQQVEYSFHIVRPMSQDFKDLILIFSEFHGLWYLVGLAHGESTI